MTNDLANVQFYEQQGTNTNSRARGNARYCVSHCEFTSKDRLHLQEEGREVGVDGLRGLLCVFAEAFRCRIRRLVV